MISNSNSSLFVDYLEHSLNATNYHEQNFNECGSQFQAIFHLQTQPNAIVTPHLDNNNNNNSNERVYKYLTAECICCMDDDGNGWLDEWMDYVLIQGMMRCSDHDVIIRTQSIS